MNTMLRAGSLALILSAASFMTPTIAVAKTNRDVPEVQCAPSKQDRDEDTGRYLGCKTSGGGKSSVREEEGDDSVRSACKQLVADIYPDSGMVGARDGAISGIGGFGQGRVITGGGALQGRYDKSAIIGGVAYGLISGLHNHDTRKVEENRCVIAGGPKRYLGGLR